MNTYQSGQIANEIREINAACTLRASDSGSVLVGNAPGTVTVPVGLPVGFACKLINTSTSSDWNISAGSGMTLKNTLGAVFSVPKGASADIFMYDENTAMLIQSRPAEEVAFIVAVSDETTDLAVGSGKANFTIPFSNFYLTGIRGDINTLSVDGNVEFDVLVEAATLFDTLPRIEEGSFSTLGANVQPVYVDSLPMRIGNTDKIRIDITEVGSTTPGKGLKVTLIGIKY